MRRPTFRTGDPVIYCKEKHGTNPGPRAHDVSPAPRGEEYHYAVDKFWVVVDGEGDEPGTLRLMTRRGKIHVVSTDDDRLRRASWWERLRFGRRFPELPQPRT